MVQIVNQLGVKKGAKSLILGMESYNIYNYSFIFFL